MTVVVMGMVLFVGIIVFKETLPTTTQYNLSGLDESINDSFELATVGLIVLAAAMIIGILIRVFVGVGDVGDDKPKKKRCKGNVNTNHYKKIRDKVSVR
jgi:hypothetical protein